MLKKNKDICDTPKKRCIPREDAPPRVSSKPGSVNMKAAKELLRKNYSMLINGVQRAPGFITTLKGVTGKNPAEKIANLRRVLSTCKRVGVPLLKKTGKGFKAYRTLVSQCKVTISKPVQNIFSERPGGSVNNRLLSKIRAFRAAKASKPLPTVEAAMLAQPVAPVQNLDEFYQDALNTPLPNDFGMRRLRFGFRRY
jgi:hypothetical protein